MLISPRGCLCQGGPDTLVQGFMNSHSARHESRSFGHQLIKGQRIEKYPQRRQPVPLRRPVLGHIAIQLLPVGEQVVLMGYDKSLVAVDDHVPDLYIPENPGKPVDDLRISRSAHERLRFEHIAPREGEIFGEHLVPAAFPGEPLVIGLEHGLNGHMYRFCG